MGQTAILSTSIPADVKRAVKAFCDRRGLKLQFFVERALLEQLEDATDLEAFEQRRNEPTVPWMPPPRPIKKR